MKAEDDTIEVHQPEYLSWDIERLRREYFSLNGKYSALKIREAGVIAEQQDLDDLARLLNRFLERNHA